MPSLHWKIELRSSPVIGNNHPAVVEVRRDEDEKYHLLSTFYVPETVLSILIMFSHLILTFILHGIIIISISQKRNLKLKDMNLLKVTNCMWQNCSLNGSYKILRHNFPPFLIK